MACPLASPNDSLSKMVRDYDPSCREDGPSAHETWWQIMATEQNNTAFIRSLSSQQQSSCLLLWEWCRSVQFLFTSERLAGDFFVSPEKPKLDPTGPFNNYHETMRALWQMEFYYSVPGEKVQAAQKLRWLRRRAINTAAAFRAALEWFSTVPKTSNPSKHCYPSPTWLLPWTMAPQIDLTPWLSNKSLHHHPYFLWDVTSKKTVRSLDLGPLPPYTAISHTWGRYRKRGTDNKPCQVSVPGVPWAVPENQWFDVRELPDLLSKQLDGVPYIWIDLFCIPQDDLRSPIALQEISRQASIFKKCTQPIAWFSDISGWSGVQSCLQQFCLDLLSSNVEAGLLQKLPDSASVGKDEMSAELVAGSELNSWFTSLWTLQEMCLRPDMIFCDAEFSPLCLADPLRPLSFHDVQALLNDHSKSSTVLTGAAEDLRFRFWGASCHFNAVWNPFTIIGIGNERYCEGRRAEAIMSVVGATNWFTTWKQQQNPDLSADPAVMVMGKYPMAFVEEMRTKYGSGNFFSAATLKMGAISRLLHSRHDSETPNSVGSLLPFGDGSVFIAGSDFMELDDDPLTSGWTVQADGSVRIDEAFVHLSQDDAVLGDIGTKIVLNSLVPGNDNIIAPLSGNLATLQEWMQDRKPEARTYAIRVQSGDFHSNGALIKEVRPGRFLMVGRFHLTRQADVAFPGKQERLDLVVL